MAEAQVFVCGNNTGMKSMFVKNYENALYLKIEDDKISGKAYVCNAEGKNGYVDEFSFTIAEMGDVTIGKYEDQQALFINTRISNIYGSKKVRIALPQLRGMDLVSGRLKRLKTDSQGQGEETPAAHSHAAPAAQVPVEAPKPVKEERVLTASQQAVMKKTEEKTEATQDEAQGAKNAAEANNTSTTNMGASNMGTSGMGYGNSTLGTPAGLGASSVSYGASGYGAAGLGGSSTLGGNGNSSLGGSSPMGGSTLGGLGGSSFASTPMGTSNTLPNGFGAATNTASQSGMLSDEEDEKERAAAEEFQQKVEKLTVLKDCGLLGEKEFNAKKIELVGQFCNLTEFNEKIQKLVALKDCGLLSESEFEANRIDIIKECCDIETPDIRAYRRNVQKLAYLEMGGVITPEEYERSKKTLVTDVEFKLTDDKESFARKLKRLPILRDASFISGDEYKKKVDDLLAMIDVKADDPIDSLGDKLSKWPILAQEKYIDQSELMNKQKELVGNYLDMNWKTLDELRACLTKLVAMRDGEWLTEMDYFTKRDETTRRIEEIPDYSTKLKAYIVLSETHFYDEMEYAQIKEKCINDIFMAGGSVADFKERANNLLVLQKVGMITEEEFGSYKMKLMSEL